MHARIDWILKIQKVEVPLSHNSASHVVIPPFQINHALSCLPLPFCSVVIVTEPGIPLSRYYIYNNQQQQNGRVQGRPRQVRSTGRSQDPQDQDHPHLQERQAFGKVYVKFDICR